MRMLRWVSVILGIVPVAFVLIAADSPRLMPKPCQSRYATYRRCVAEHDQSVLRGDAAGFHRRR